MNTMTWNDIYSYYQKSGRFGNNPHYKALHFHRTLMNDSGYHGLPHDPEAPKGETFDQRKARLIQKSLDTLPDFFAKSKALFAAPEIQQLHKHLQSGLLNCGMLDGLSNYIENEADKINLPAYIVTAYARLYFYHQLTTRFEPVYKAAKTQQEKTQLIDNLWKECRTDPREAPISMVDNILSKQPALYRDAGKLHHFLMGSVDHADTMKAILMKKPVPYLNQAAIDNSASYTVDIEDIRKNHSRAFNKKNIDTFVKNTDNMALFWYGLLIRTNNYPYDIFRKWNFYIQSPRYTAHSYATAYLRQALADNADSVKNENNGIGNKKTDLYKRLKAFSSYIQDDEQSLLFSNWTDAYGKECHNALQILKNTAYKQQQSSKDNPLTSAQKEAATKAIQTIETIQRKRFTAWLQRPELGLMNVFKNKKYSLDDLKSVLSKDRYLRQEAAFIYEIAILEKQLDPKNKASFWHMKSVSDKMDFYNQYHDADEKDRFHDMALEYSKFAQTTPLKKDYIAYYHLFSPNHIGFRPINQKLENTFYYKIKTSPIIPAIPQSWSEWWNNEILTTNVMFFARYNQTIKFKGAAEEEINITPGFNLLAYSDSGDAIGCATRYKIKHSMIDNVSIQSNGTKFAYYATDYTKPFIFLEPKDRWLPGKDDETITIKPHPFMHYYIDKHAITFDYGMLKNNRIFWVGKGKTIATSMDHSHVSTTGDLNILAPAANANANASAASDTAKHAPQKKQPGGISITENHIFVQNGLVMKGDFNKIRYNTIQAGSGDIDITAQEFFNSTIKLTGDGESISSNKIKVKSKKMGGLYLDCSGNTDVHFTDVLVFDPSRIMFKQPLITSQATLVKDHTSSFTMNLPQERAHTIQKTEFILEQSIVNINIKTKNNKDLDIESYVSPYYTTSFQNQVLFHSVMNDYNCKKHQISTTGGLSQDYFHIDFSNIKINNDLPSGQPPLLDLTIQNLELGARTAGYKGDRFCLRIGADNNPATIQKLQQSFNDQLRELSDLGNKTGEINLYAPHNNDIHLVRIHLKSIRHGQGKPSVGIFNNSHGKKWHQNK
jgi:hypothetical protein